jgi:hypothetical protein
MVINKRMIWECADDELALEYGRREVEIVRALVPTDEGYQDDLAGWAAHVIDWGDPGDLVDVYEDELSCRPEDLPMVQRRGLELCAEAIAEHGNPKLLPPYKGRMIVLRCSQSKGTVLELPWSPEGLSDPGVEPFGDFVKGYVECMIWSSNTDGNEEDHSEEGGVNYNITDDLDWDDLSVECKKQAIDDCRGFLQECKQEGIDIDALDYGSRGKEWSNMALAGHDFWLTRNGHGAGFWDRDLGEVGDKLTKMSKVWGGQDICVGEDGLVY